MKNILLPTDFSDNSFNAIEYAVQLFKDDNCTFHLINTFMPIAYNVGTFHDGYSTLMLEEITRKNSERSLLEIEEKMKKKFNNPKHTFKHLASFNLLTDAIIAAVKENSVNVIVMGTKGATGAKEVFLGTNTMFTIKKAQCPVIAVPDQFSFKEPVKILFPTDFKFSTENENLKLLKSICNLHQAQLNILNIYLSQPLSQEQQEVKNQLEDLFKDNSLVFHTTEDVDIAEAVQQFQIKRNIKFLVMIQNKHSFFENLLFKPIIKQMVYHTNVPFMVIPSVELMKE